MKNRKKKQTQGFCIYVVVSYAMIRIIRFRRYYQQNITTEVIKHEKIYKYIHIYIFFSLKYK